MKIMIQKRVTGLKGFVIFTLIIAMLVTLIPANALAQSHAYTTEDPNAELYPYPLDMKILSKYLYGSEENVKGKVLTYYPGSKYSKKVTSKTKKLWVHGTTKSLESYCINNMDYFKLDDIAQMMAGTNKSFDVKYDKAKRAILINSMSQYKGKTTTMKKGDGKKRKAVVPDDSIVWDGQVIGISCYKINGSYYVSVWEMAALTDSRIESTRSGWDIMTTKPNKVDAYG